MEKSLAAWLVTMIMPIFPALGQTIDDAVNQFNNTGAQPESGNPWTYGTETSLNGTFNLFPSFAANQSCTGSCSPAGQTYSTYYFTSANAGAGVNANTSAHPVTTTFNGSPNLVWPIDTLLVGPSGLNRGTPLLAVVRWTAPQAGTYTLSGFFLNLQQANTYEYVLHNGTTIFENSNTFNGKEEAGLGIQIFVATDNIVTVAEGDTIDFIVATSPGTNDYNDTVGLSATLVPGSLGAISYNATSNFNLTGTQPESGNAWTYGTETSLNGPFSLFPATHFANEICNGTACTPNAAGYSVYYYQSANAGPGVDINTSGTLIAFPDSPPLNWPSALVLMGPGDGSNPDYAVVRWTAPSAGAYSINGYWQDCQQASSGVHVSVNGGAQQVDGSYNGSSVEQGQVFFALNGVSLNAGGTVDFIVDNGNGSNSNDALGLQATIQQYVTATALTPQTGTPPSAMVDAGFGSPLSALVTDSSGAPLAGVTVTFTAPSSGASASLNFAYAITGANGIATVYATANSTPGSYNVTFTAGNQSANFALTNVALAAVNLPSTRLGGGESTTNNTVTLTSAAPPGGATITLSSSHPKVASVPASVAIAAGQTSGSFTIATGAVSGTTPVTLTGSDGTTTQTASLTVVPVALSAVAVVATVVGGDPTHENEVRLTAGAPQAGAVVTLSSSDPTVASPPASVTVPNGSAIAVFTIQTTYVATSQVVTISATYNGVTKTANVTVTPVQLLGLTLSPSTVTRRHDDG